MNFEQFVDIIGSFGSAQPESGTTFPFQYNKYLKHISVSSTWAPPMAKIYTCVHWLFCTKFNSQQCLFEQLFDIIGNFGSLQPKNESTFPFQCNIIFETHPPFEPLAPLRGEIEMRVHWFFRKKFNSQQVLFEQFVYIIGNFCSAQPLKWIYFLISMYDNILHDHLCDPRLPTFETLSFFAYIKL